MAKQTKQTVNNEDEEKRLTVTGDKGGLAIAPDFIADADFGSGLEGADSSDAYAIPFIQVLQKMSPMVDEDQPQYVDGAKAGMFYNTVTRRLYDGKTGLRIIPCAFKRSFIKWAPRDAGGGFKGEFTPEVVDEMTRKGQIVEENGRLYEPQKDGTIDPKKCDYFADTRSHYVIVVDDETGEHSWAVIALASTMRKASRSLMTLLHNKLVTVGEQKRRPPTYANIARITTTAESNEKGNWSGVKFELEGMVKDRDLYESAKDFYKQVNGGAVKADFNKADAAATGDNGSTDGPQKADEF